MSKNENPIIQRKCKIKPVRAKPHNLSQSDMTYNFRLNNQVKMFGTVNLYSLDRRPDFRWEYVDTSKTKYIRQGN